MSKPHKHAECIKAWADGKEVEWHNPGSLKRNWNPIGSHPMWYPNFEYRIKPELKDPGEVCRTAWYSHADLLPTHSEEWQKSRWNEAAKAVIKAYKAGELKDF